MLMVEGTDKVWPGRSPKAPRKCREDGSLDTGCVIRALQNMADEVGRIRCRCVMHYAHSLPSAMTPFQLLFGRSPRITLDVLVPQMDDAEATGGLSNSIESRRHNMREVAEALKKLHEDKEAAP